MVNSALGYQRMSLWKVSLGHLETRKLLQVDTGGLEIIKDSNLNFLILYLLSLLLEVLFYHLSFFQALNSSSNMDFTQIHILYLIFHFENSLKHCLKEVYVEVFGYIGTELPPDIIIDLTCSKEVPLQYSQAKKGNILFAMEKRIKPFGDLQLLLLVNV